MRRLDFQAEGLDERRLSRLVHSKKSMAPLLVAAAVTVAVLYSRGAVTAIITPGFLTFGDQPVGAAATLQVLTVTNPGTSPLRITQVSVTGQSRGDFRLLNGCDVIESERSCEIGVGFTPLAVAARVATVEILEENSRIPHAVPLSGGGLARDDLVVSPPALDFGSPKVGVSIQKSVRVSNTGSIPLALRLELQDDANSEYSIVEERCSQARLAARRSCTVQLAFRPRAAARSNAELRITDATGDAPHLVVLTGLGAQPGSDHLTVEPPTLSFGDQLVGSASSQPVRILSSGSLRIGDIAIAPAGIADFQVAGNPCSGQLLERAAACVIAVRFFPTAAGLRTGVLLISDGSERDTHRILLSGTGLAPTYAHLSAASPFVDFGDAVPAGRGSESTARFISDGSADARITGLGIEGPSSTDFTIGTSNCRSAILSPGRECWATVRFAPRQAGPRSATFVIDSNSRTGRLRLPLEGAAAEPPPATISLAPERLIFGSQKRRTASGAQIATVTGSASAQVFAVRLEGPAAKDFRVQRENCRDHRFAMAGTCEIAVAFSPGPVLFNPKKSSARDAALVVEDNTAQTRHEVGLTGLASRPTPPIKALLVTEGLYFEAVAAGSRSKEQFVTVTNTSQNSVQIQDISLHSPFERISTDCNGHALPAGGACRIGIVFYPPTSGNFSGTLEIRDGIADVPYSVRLSGSGKESLVPPSHKASVQRVPSRVRISTTTPLLPGYCCYKGKDGEPTVSEVTSVNCAQMKGYFSLIESEAQGNCTLIR